ncbi:Uncharacterised protein [Mycobacterium tuberculosis]|nr:Uncharacterised protein [Mycobacterium tuberculosis]
MARKVGSSGTAKRSALSLNAFDHTRSAGQIGPSPGPVSSSATVVPDAMSSSSVRSADMRFFSVRARGRGPTARWLSTFVSRRSGPRKPNHSSLSPNPSGPIRARHRCRRSAAEYTGSVAVSMGGIGNSSE